MEQQHGEIYWLPSVLCWLCYPMSFLGGFLLPVTNKHILMLNIYRVDRLKDILYMDMEQ